MAMSLPSSAAVHCFCFRLVAAGLLPLAAVGCAGRGNVSGKVTYQGRPLAWGTVQFEGSDHIVKQANINSDGTYTVPGVATGDAKIAVSSVDPRSSDFQPIQREGQAPRKPRPEVKGWFEIPKKYETTFNSGLTYTVKRGNNEFDIKLD
jgi:hypothetical protein